MRNYSSSITIAYNSHGIKKANVNKFSSSSIQVLFLTAQTLNRSMHEMESVSTRNTYLILPDVLAASDEFGFNRFTFEIEANGEVLFVFYNLLF